MDRKSRQEALDEISAEDLAKVKAHQSSTQGGHTVDSEWLLLAEFAKAYGWLAYKDARDDLVSLREMLTLIEANRVLEYQKMYDNTQAAFIASLSSRAKKPGQMFAKLTKDIVKRMKVKT